MSKPHQQALNHLREKLPPEVIATGDDERYRASLDNLRLSRLPSAVLHPEDEDQVEIILVAANNDHVPLTCRGAGSAATGTTSPLPGGWVMDLAHWRNFHIDPVAQMAYVQPGITVEELDNAAAEYGLFYPPDPGSKKFATIGGTLATNAGGLRGARYGVTRDYVYSLEGFLPTGEFVRWGANLKKFVSGYNMRDLWIGSEGTLGVITGAVLKLIARPEARGTMLVTFPHEHAALATVRDMLEQRFSPSILEFLDTQTIACTESFWKAKDPELLRAFPLSLRNTANDPVALLLIEFDGSHQDVSDAVKDFSAFLKKSPANEWTSTQVESESEQFWKIRRSCSQAMFQLGNSKINEDIVVPFQSYESLIDYMLQVKEETGLATPTFGHAADGNFHVHIMFDRNSDAECSLVKSGIDKVMQQVIDLGGAISGEHGIGLAKSPFLQYQHSPAEIQAMKAVKNALDPNGILNPDKIWTPFEVWDYPRENIRLPWDH